MVASALSSIASASVPSTGAAPIVPSGACPGTELSGQYAGTLAVEGGPLPANATAGVDVLLTVHYEVTDRYEPSGVVKSVGCVLLTENVATNGSGGFALVPDPFQDGCVWTLGGIVCTNYTGPRGPITAALAGPVPSGYSPSFSTTSVQGDLALVWELASVTLAPGGPTLTVAPGAATAIVATSWEANGSATPLDPEYSWDLNGTGWAFDGPPSGDRAVVVSVPGAAAGALTVRAEAWTNGTHLATPPVSIALNAVATTIAGAGLNRTDLDVGSALNADVEAVGASGYEYRAWFAPGLGLAPVPVPCGVSGYGPGTVLARCIANVTYTGPGIAQPTANVTNGFSTAFWSFPNVTVNPPAALWVAPSAPTGYTHAPVSVTLVATSGSGTLPFTSACLEAGSAPVECTTAPGPYWTFTPVFRSAGVYSAEAWAIDSGGTNRSVSFSVTIVDPLAVTPLDLVTANVTVGANATVNSTVSGGDLPGRFWWNSSVVEGTLRTGSLGSDGPLSLSFTPSAAGPLTVTLSVIDALGTLVHESLAITVGPPPATRVVEVGSPPTSPILVGESADVSWQAFDRYDEPVPTFSTAAEVVLSGTGAPAPTGWVNASAVGPLAETVDGTFAVPAAAWVNGTLDASIGVTNAGAFSVELVGAGLPSPVASIYLRADPDLAHLRLYDPVVAEGGARNNSTLWSVSDRFGNAVPGANLTIRFVWGSSSSNERVVAVVAPNGSTGVWINYSAPGSEGGTVSVFDSAGDLLLPPVAVPAVAGTASPLAPYDVLAGGVGAGAAGAGVGTIALRRRRPRRSDRSGEAELERLAQGRATLVELVRRDGPLDLPEIEAAWRPPPAPPDLADWLASLVADGTLGATVGSDGRARFCLAPGPSSPRVTVDSEAFDEALRRRDREIEDDRPGL